VRLTVLGCSGTFSGPTEACSSYLLEQDGFRLLMDMGSGALGALQRHGDLRDLDAVWISHLHADHFIDLVPLAVARRYHPDGVPPPLDVYGPTGTRERVEAGFGRPGLEDVYTFHVVEPGQLPLGPFDVTLTEVAHPATCYAARLTSGGRTLAYSADTGPTDALVDAARGADVLLCEASWTDKPGLPPDIHLTGRQAGEHAKRAGVPSLWLTHIVPWTDAEAVRAEAAEVYDGALDIARCDAAFDV
jgi:ribonuclease BN (tRNA processing enzyme)